MAADPIYVPPDAPASTIFAHLERDRIAARPWVAFVFDQADPVEGGLNSVGQALYIGRGLLTTLFVDTPTKLAELEASAVAYVQSGKTIDSAETTVAYELLAACAEAGTIAAIAELNVEVRGNFIPWS